MNHQKVVLKTSAKMLETSHLYAVSERPVKLLMWREIKNFSVYVGFSPRQRVIAYGLCRVDGA